MRLIELGWDSFLEKNFESYKNQNLTPARIARENRSNYLTLGEDGEFVGEISGKFRHETGIGGQLPTVGDWVAIAVRPDEGKAIIQALLPRKSAFVRKVAGTTTEEQIIAANLDFAFIVCGLDSNFSLRRIERYLALAWESGAMPVVILNKADLCSNEESCHAKVSAIAIGVPIHVVSGTTGRGMDIFADYLKSGKTAAFIGSSGVGKSTMINSLLGADRLKVREVREYDCRGRHTTTFREMILLPGGGIVIDTPGMRELQTWGDEDGLDQTFDDIIELATDCRFTDCSHLSEPGCAVKAAVEQGVLDPARLRNFMKLKREFKYLVTRQAMKASKIEKDRWKKISQYQKSLKRRN